MSRIRIVSLFALTFVSAAGGCTVFDPQARRAHDPWTPAANPPDIRWKDVREAVGPLDVRLKDGRVVRLAHFAEPPPGDAAGAEQKRRMVESFFHRKRRYHERRLRGLKTVGTDSDGTPLVEIWGFPGLVWICGNTTALERARTQRRWMHDLQEVMFETGGVLGLGPDVTNGDLLELQARMDQSRRRYGG